MKREKLRLLSLLLCLSLPLSACGASTSGSGKIPGGTELSADTDEVAYSDRLLEEYCSIDTAVRNENGEFPVSIHIPQLKSDAEQAAELNRQLVSIWDAYLNDDKSVNQSAVTGDLSITWESRWNDSLVSLILTEKLMDFETVFVFHYDFYEEEQYNGAQLLRRLNISDEAFTAAVCRAAAREFDTTDYAEESTDARYLLRAQAIANAADTVYEPNFYPDSENELTVFVPFAVPAGAGYAEKELHITLPNATAPLSAEADGVTAKLEADGALTVTFAATAQNQQYAEQYGFACGKAYPISGCLSGYTKLFIGSMGPDYNPYLFLLTDKGTAEFVRLFGGAYFGKFVCGGPLYGLTGITDFETAQSTVYAVGADGAKHDLSDAVSKAEQAFPQTLSGTWSSTQYRADGSTEYTLDIQPNGAMVECTFYENVPDENIHVSYTGLLGLVGMDETGLICGYTLTGPDGNDLVGAVALLPQWDTMMVQPVSGDSLFDAPDGLQFMRSAG